MKNKVPRVTFAFLIIVATTTVGVTTSDYLKRTAGVGYLWQT